MVNRKQFDKRFLISAVAVALTTTAVVPAASAASGFSDVPPHNSHAENIAQAVDMGLIKGQNGKFHPNDTITRGQVVKILARYLENKHGKNNYSKVQPFADVSAKSKDKELYNASRVVKYHNAFGGDNNHLRPGELMTREQMASVLVGAFGLESDGRNVNITDLNQASSHHMPNVQTIANLGITQTTNGRFSPKQAVTRAQFASFFVRTVDSYGGIPNSLKKLKINKVVELNDANQFVRIEFSHAVPKLVPADIDIRHAKTGANYPVKAVKLSENGKSADVELFDNPKVGQVDVDDYHLTINIGGDQLTYSFNRSSYAESLVIDVDVLKNKFTVYTEKGSTKTYDIPASLKKQDTYKMLGETVGIWYDSKNKPTDVELVTQRAKYDAIEITKLDEIRLISENRNYKISTAAFEGSSAKKQFAFYLDGKKVDIGDRNDTKKKAKIKDRFTYAKIGFDNSGNILYVSAYNLHEFLIVDRIEEQNVIGYIGEGTGGIFNAKDALILKDGSVITPSELRRGDVMFFNEKGNKGKGIAEVLQPVAKGKIDSVSSQEIQIAGMTYRFKDTHHTEDYKVNYERAVYLHPDGKTEFIDSDVAKGLQQSGAVEAYADRAGNLVYIAGGPISIGRKQSVGILIDDIVGDREATREYLEVEALLASGEKKWFTSELENLKTIIVDDVTYNINNNGRSDWKITFEYKDKKERKDPTAILLTSKTDKKTVKVPMANTKGNLVRLHMDRNQGKLETIEFFKKRSAKKKVVVKPSDTLISGKLLSPETIVFDTEYFSNHSRDIKITKWSEQKGSTRVASMIFDENNIILAFITDQPPKSASLSNSIGELAWTAGEADTYVDQLEMLRNGTVVSIDQAKVSQMVPVITQPVSQEEAATVINMTGETKFEAWR